MSYMVDKFKAGEVHIREDGACGWLFDNGEFRPLMADAMYELVDAGLVTEFIAQCTEEARVKHTREVLAAYTKQQEEFETAPEYEDARQERDFEMRAAFGPGETVVNVITGKRTKL